MPVSWQANLHTGADATNDPALIAIRCVGAGYPGVISPDHQRILVSVRRH
jgi:hypothetical protein